MPNFISNITPNGGDIYGKNASGNAGFIPVDELVNITSPATARVSDLSGGQISGIYPAPLSSLGSELISDPSLDGAYTAGKNAIMNITTNGWPVQSASSFVGTKAQKAYASTNAGGAVKLYTSVATEAGKWYRSSFMVKSETTEGEDWKPYLYSAAGVYPILSASGNTIVATSYKRRLMTFRAATTAIQVGCSTNSTYAAKAAGVQSGSIIVDAISCREIPLASLVELVDSGKNYGKWFCGLTINEISQAGLMICADSATAPANFILVFHDGTSLNFWKCIAGVYSEAAAVENRPNYILATNPNVAYSSGAKLVVARKTGTNIFTVYYNGMFIGQETIANAEIVDNVIHGPFNTFEENIIDYTYSPADVLKNVVFIGGSITNGASASDDFHSFQSLLRTKLDIKYPQISFTYTKAAAGGTDSFYTLCRLTDDLLSVKPDIIFLDMAVNDGELSPAMTGWPYVGESIVRRIRKAYPTSKLIICNFMRPVGSDSTPDTNTENLRAGWNAIAARYRCQLYRLDTALLTALGASPTEAQIDAFFASAGNVHPNSDGHALIAGDLFEVEVLAHDIWGGDINAIARLGDTEIYEKNPRIILGTDLLTNSLSTGSWAAGIDNEITSSTAGSTITYVGEMAIVGLSVDLQASAWPTGLQYSLDGAAFSAISARNPAVGESEFLYLDGEEHVLTIKLNSGSVSINKMLIL